MATGREVATNRDGRTVAGAINEVVKDVFDHPAKQDYEMWIATAYFNTGGYSLLADELERVPRVRLLLGAEPLTYTPARQPLTTGGPRQRERLTVRRALEGHARSIEEDRDLLGFEESADATARRLIAWLHSGKAQVRRYERTFLHGKAFLVLRGEQGNGEGVVAGSSNFTYAGLAVNDELNLGWYQPYVVGQVRDWFQAIWDQAVEFDLAAVYEERFRPHDPYIVYMRMLYERYGDEVEAEARAEGQIGVHLMTFQRDGVWRAKRILDEHHGVVIADGVGLGKTFVGGAIVEEYERERRQRVLIMAPAALRDGPWRKFLEDHMLAAKCISFEDFASQMEASGGQSIAGQRIQDYALIVVDEGHAFRNPATQRAQALRELLAGRPAKDLVLLTATPVNNSLFDLHNLLSLFIKNDAAFADRGILSLRRRFAEAAALDPEDLAPDKLFDILDAVAVRRTRRFVKDYYADAKLRVDGQDITITFPNVKLEPPVGYDLEPLLPTFFERLEHVLDCALGHCAHPPATAALPTLTLARYTPSRYLRSGRQDAYEAQLAGLLRTGLLKRFESSVHAFALTCERMAESHDSFLSLLDQGRVATGAGLVEWSAAETDDLGEMVVPPTVVEERSDASIYDRPRLRADVGGDRDLLRAFAAEAHTIDRRRDPKLVALIDQLAAIAAQARAEAISDSDERDKRKVIVFSYYTDTVNWIEQHVADVLDPTSALYDPRIDAYRGRVASIWGDASQDKTRIMWGFAPVSSQAPPGHDEDQCDLLISTDVLAEGVNLQQARHIINYDLPWNPMRLVQRHGRIDRIGSVHERVFIRCFFPELELDRILRLEERLKRKLTQAAKSVGVESETLPGSLLDADIIFSETRDEIERLRRQDPTLFERGGEGETAYSGEEYRQELRRALQDPGLAERIKTLPWGAGSGHFISGPEPGFIFCVRVGDHPQPVFRWVAMPNTGQTRLVDDTLACLAHAHADPDTERVLAADTHRSAYSAWALARRDIYESWTRATDPANLLPEIPRPMRDAVALLTNQTPAGMTRQRADELAAALSAAYPPRIQAVFRAVLRTDATDQHKADRIAHEAERLGLQPSPPPEPLPIIAEEDVHLVCWMAVAGDPGLSYGGS